MAKSKKGKKGKIDKNSPEYIDGLKTGASIALETHAGEWKWSNCMGKTFGDPMTKPRKMLEVTEEFIDGILNYHSKSGGTEGIGRESIPTASKLMQYWKIGFLFPAEQRDGLSMAAAALLVKHVDDHERRGALLAEMIEKGILPNKLATEHFLTEKGLIAAAPETSAFGLNTKRVRSITAAAGRIKLDTGEMTENQSEQIAAQLMASVPVIIGVAESVVQKWREEQEQEPEQKVKKRKAA